MHIAGYSTPSIIYGDSVEELCDSKCAGRTIRFYKFSGCLTPRPNVSVKHSEDDRISQQDDIPIANSRVQTPDTII